MLLKHTQRNFTNKQYFGVVLKILSCKMLLCQNVFFVSGTKYVSAYKVLFYPQSFVLPTKFCSTHKVLLHQQNVVEQNRYISEQWMLLGLNLNCLSLRNLVKILKTQAGVNVMITISRDFRQFSAKKLAFFSKKTML
jgi:hypothetical protein